MKLIIDIPEEEYIKICDEPCTELALAVKNGTPLDTHDEEIIAQTVESIWGKPPYTELFDTIKVEIEFEVDHRTNMLCAEDVFQIIDKYKAERSEE